MPSTIGNSGSCNSARGHMHVQMRCFVITCRNTLYADAVARFDRGTTCALHLLVCFATYHRRRQHRHERLTTSTQLRGAHVSVALPGKQAAHAAGRRANGLLMFFIMLPPALKAKDTAPRTRSTKVYPNPKVHSKGWNPLHEKVGWPRQTCSGSKQRDNGDTIGLRPSAKAPEQIPAFFARGLLSSPPSSLLRLRKANEVRAKQGGGWGEGDRTHPSVAQKYVIIRTDFHSQVWPE